MGFLSTKSIAWLSVLAACSIANGSNLPRTDGLDAFVKKQRAISLQSVLNNIGPDGSRVPGAGAGVIVASPSTVNPNCKFAVNIINHILETDGMVDFYTWTRDAALTMKMIVDEFLLGEKQLKPYIEDYIHSQAVLQYEALSHSINLCTLIIDP